MRLAEREEFSAFLAAAQLLNNFFEHFLFVGVLLQGSHLVEAGADYSDLQLLRKARIAHSIQFIISLIYNSSDLPPKTAFRLSAAPPRTQPLQNHKHPIFDILLTDIDR